MLGYNTLVALLIICTGFILILFKDLSEASKIIEELRFREEELLSDYNQEIKRSDSFYFNYVKEKLLVKEFDNHFEKELKLKASLKKDLNYDSEYFHLI